jgi:hypothetical protein
MPPADEHGPLSGSRTCIIFIILIVVTKYMKRCGMSLDGDRFLKFDYRSWLNTYCGIGIDSKCHKGSK